MVIRQAVWIGDGKHISGKRIMIDRDCGFLVVAGSVSSLGND